MINPDLSLQPQAVELIFADNGSLPDTITRVSGSWLLDQFAANQTLFVVGTNFNDNTYRIAAVSADGRTLTLTADAQLRNERTVTGARRDVQGVAALTAEVEGDPSPFLVFSAANRSIRRTDIRTWAADGFAVGQTISVTNTQFNDGQYVVTGVSGDGLTLFLAAATFTDENTEQNPDPAALPVEVTAVAAVARPELRFGGNTITRSVGSWLDDGFTVGSKISINDTAANNGQLVITGIIDGGRTLQFDLGTTPEGVVIQFIPEFTREATVNGLTELTKPDGSPMTVGDIGGTLLTRIDAITDLLSGFLAQATLMSSTSALTVASGADIRATRDIMLQSLAASELDASVESLWLGFSYGRSNATSTTVIADNTSVIAGGNVAIAANVVNTMTAGTKIKMGMNPKAMFVQARLTGRASLIPGPAFGVGIGVANSVSRATIGGPNSFISGENVQIGALNKNAFAVQSKPAIKGLSVANTGGAATVVISDVESHADTVLSGTVHARNDLDVTAKSVNLTNDSFGQAKVKREATKKGGVGGAVTGFAQSRLKNVNIEEVTNAGAISGGAAVVIASSTNEANVVVDATGRLFAGADATVQGYAEDNHRAIGIAAAKANSKVALAGAVVVTDYRNAAGARLAGGAVISAGGALSVRSDAVIPNQIEVDNIIRSLVNPPGLFPAPTSPIDNSNLVAASQSAQQASQDQLGWAQENL